jgi:hypothetical protein
MGTYCLTLPEGSGRSFFKKFGNALHDITFQKAETLISFNLDHKNINSNVILFVIQM